MSNLEIFAKDYGVPIIRLKSHEVLKQQINIDKPKHILEVGTAIGYSGILMLENSEADLITIEHNKEYIKQAKVNFKRKELSKRVKIIDGDCLVELAKMVASGKYDNYFDFIFLDGPKAQYDLMLELLVILLDKGGTLIVDNVLFRGYVEGTSSPPTRRYKTIIKRLNEFIKNCKNHPKLNKFELINIEDGMIICKKEKNETEQN